MIAWQGRARVLQLRGSLEAAFERAKAVPETDYKLRTDLARNLCVMVSGWLERAMHELATARCRRHVSGPVLSFAISQLEWSRNPTTENLAALIGCFDLGWRDNLEQGLTLEQKVAINSIVGLRNDVAHGRWEGTSSLTIRRVEEYFLAIRSVVNDLMEVFDPPVPA